MADALSTGAALPDPVANYHYASLYCLTITKAVQSLIQTAQSASDDVTAAVINGATVSSNVGASGAAVQAGQALLTAVADFYNNSQDTDDALSEDDAIKWTGIVSLYGSFQSASAGVGSEGITINPPGGFNSAIDSIGNAFAKTAKGLASALDYGIVAAVVVLVAGLGFYVYTKVKK